MQQTKCMQKSESHSQSKSVDTDKYMYCELLCYIERISNNVGLCLKYITCGIVECSFENSL